MKCREVRGAGNVIQGKDQKFIHFDHRPKGIGLPEFILKSFLHGMNCYCIRLWEKHMYGKTKKNFSCYDHVTSSLCLADKVSDMPVSSIQQHIVAFVKTTEFDPLETATSRWL
jgi:hypothetical protein